MRQSFREEFSTLIEPLAQYRRRRLWEMLEEIEKRIDGLNAFKQSVDEACNTGDGSYRP